MAEARGRERRALSHVGGPAVLHGDPEAAKALAHALDVSTSLEAEDPARAHVHGFHSYPARMHPVTARRAIQAFAKPGARVLDPFAGSGTVLVEARLFGCGATGVDANPLAVRLARLKARGVGEVERARLVEGARAAAAKADARRKAKAGATQRYGHEDVALFAPHVLLELDGLRAGIHELGDLASSTGVRADLELVLSAILTKVSRRASDTNEQALERRIAAGYPSRLFVKKTEELVTRLGEVAETLIAAPPLDVRLGDARRLEGAAEQAGDVRSRKAPSSPLAPVELVVTSPPYPGNYDYLAQHAARLRWLRLDARSLEEAEIGARRKLEPLGAAAGQAAFERDLSLCLSSVRRVLAPAGKVALLVADSVIGGRAVRAPELVRRAASRVGLAVTAVASQPRPHFHAPSQRAFQGGSRAEHFILLEVASR